MRKQTSIAGVLPSICVAIPCKDNSCTLDGVLESIRCQTDRANELIIVDDNSIRNEAHALQHLARQYGAKYVRLPNPSHSGDFQGRRSLARNAATKYAHSEVMLYLDGDMLLHPAYIEEIRQYHAIDPRAMVRGQRFSIPQRDQERGMAYCLTCASSHLSLDQESLVSYSIQETGSLKHWASVTHLAAVAAIWNDPSRVGRREWLLRALFFAGTIVVFRPFSFLWSDHSLPYSYRWDWCTSNNLSVRRTRVIEVGLWDENFVGWGEEDIDFAYRLFLAGARPVLPFRTSARAFHLDHPVDSEANRSTLLRNARYLTAKFPELLPIRLPAYRNFGFDRDDILGKAPDKREA